MVTARVSTLGVSDRSRMFDSPQHVKLARPIVTGVPKARFRLF